MSNMENNNLVTLSFTDEIGYTEFKVDKTWLESLNIKDPETIYHKACENPDESLIN